MKLVQYETSRVVFLTHVIRPGGQLYVPDAIAKMAQRYSFVKTPSVDQQAFPLTFGIGKFRETQITELGIFNDGVIVSAASDTDVIDAFIDDLLTWTKKEFHLVALDTIAHDKFYESNVVVQSTVDLSATLGPTIELKDHISAALTSAGIAAPLHLSGVLFDFDTADFMGKRKPLRFVIDRRIGVVFSQKLFFSQGPFKTKDHLKVLSSLEASASPKKGTRLS